MHRRRIEHGIPLHQTARLDDFYFRKPAEPATGILGILLATNGIGLTIAPAIWALIVGIQKKHKFMLVTGIIGILLSIVTVAVMFFFVFKDFKNFDVSAQDILQRGAVSSEAKTGQNGITTKYPTSMKMTEDSATTLRFEYVSSTFGTVSIDASERYEVSRLHDQYTRHETYEALADINHPKHHTAWATYIGRGESHGIKARNYPSYLLDIEYAELGQIYRSLIALKEIDGETVLVSYAYPAFGSFNDKTFDDKQWRALVDSVKINEAR